MSSIDYDCLLTSEYYNEDTLDKAVENYFSCKLRVSERFGSTVYMEAQAGENLLFGIYLINYENEAVWDSDIIGRDYHYRQCVSIALDKEHVMYFGNAFFGLYLIVGKNQAANKGLGIVLFIVGLLIWAKYGLFS